jgi:hypothetical protein
VSGGAFVFDPWAALAAGGAAATIGAPTPSKARSPSGQAVHGLGELAGLGGGLSSVCEAEATVAAPSAPVLTPHAAHLLRFAEEAYAALVEREPDPVEAEGDAAAYGDADAVEGAGG